MSYNPYQDMPSQPRDSKSDRQAAEGKVKTPAILLLLSGVVNLLSMLGSGAVLFVTFALNKATLMDQVLEQQQNDPNVTPETMEIAFAFYTYLGVALSVFGLLFGAFIIFAAYRMLNLKGWGMAVTAAILSVVPCFQSCCILSLPVGIYALVVLFDENVKQNFK